MSEKMVYDDYYTSLHIDEFEIEARDTKLGAEEFTYEIPNVKEESKKNLDACRGNDKGALFLYNNESILFSCENSVDIIENDINIIKRFLMELSPQLLVMLYLLQFLAIVLFCKCNNHMQL